MTLEQKIEDYLNGTGFSDNASEEKSHIQMATRVGTEAIKEYILNKVISPEAKQAHLNGQIYVHNLDHLGGYCSSIDPTIPLSEGLNLPTVKANPSKHLTSAIDHLYAYLMYSQNHFSGAQSIDWVNWFLAPYVRVDNLTDREIEDCIQRWFFNCNQVTRTGGKPPFINMGLRMICPKPLQNRIARVNGKVITNFTPTVRDTTYEDLKPEADRIYHIIMKVCRQGMKGGLPFTYPLVATTIGKDTDFEGELWLDTCETIAHNGSIYIVNTIPEYMQANGDCDIVSSQCCRVRTKFAKVAGIWSGGEMGTGANRIITLNMARLVLDAKSQSGDILDLLHERLELIHQTLLDLNQMVWNSIYKWDLNAWLQQKTPDGIPYYDFKTRRLLVGVAFIHDMLIHMGYDGGLMQPDARAKAKLIFQSIRTTLERWTKEDGIQYGLEAPPNESSNHYMCSADIKEYGKDNVSWHGGIEARDEEYAPATHLPYEMRYIKLDEKIKIEEIFHELCDGGNIFHLWTGESQAVETTESISKMMQHLAKDTQLAYWAVNPRFAICANGHCTKTQGNACPQCGAEITDFMDRIVGYMERVSKFNPSKRTEFIQRRRWTQEEIENDNKKWEEDCKEFGIDLS